MIQFKQHRPFFATSSSSWMLLLLSLYFSWICPIESVTRPCGYDIVLVGQQPIEAQGCFYQCSFKACKGYNPKDHRPVFSFQERVDCFRVQAKTTWFQSRQRQDLLPASSTFIQFQTHLPRNIASC